MKPDKRKLTVLGIVLVVVVFITLYTIKVLNIENLEPAHLEETVVPELKEEKKQYESRLEAVDNLIESKPQSLPGLYEEKYLGNDGNYDPYLEEKEKLALMDSFLTGGPDMDDYTYDELLTNRVEKQVDSSVTIMDKPELEMIGEGHKQFFLSPKLVEKSSNVPSITVRAEVNGDQLIRQDQRLELKLKEPFIFQGDTVAKNTILFAFCSFQPNRLILQIEKLGNKTVQLAGYDISDGQKGIYIENSFRSRASSEVVDEVIQDINISGLPQVSGLKGLFRQHNRNVKVRVLHQYQLILKPVL